VPEVTTDSDLKQRVVELESERDEYKRLYVSMMEAYRKLEAGLVGQKRERHISTSEQLTMDVVSMLVPAPSDEAVPTPSTTVEKHERAKPTGRKPLPEKLPRVLIEVRAAPGARCLRPHR